MITQVFSFPSFRTGRPGGSVGTRKFFEESGRGFESWCTHTIWDLSSYIAQQWSDSGAYFAHDIISVGVEPCLRETDSKILIESGFLSFSST